MPVISLKNRFQIDPADFIKAMFGLAIVKEITYESATLTAGTLPAYSFAPWVFIVRVTPWDVITSILVGKSGDTDWLADTDDANLTAPLPSNEDLGVEAIAINKGVLTDTDILVTINQGAASAGLAYIVIPFVELQR